jgi:hypothetical protein
VAIAGDVRFYRRDPAPVGAVASLPHAFHGTRQKLRAAVGFGWTINYPSADLGILPRRLGAARVVVMLVSNMIAAAAEASRAGHAPVLHA